MPDVTPETFLGDADVEDIPWTRPSGSPTTLTTNRVLIAPNTDGLEVALALATSKPRTDDVRRLWNLRWARRAAPVILVVAYPHEQTWHASVCGTKNDPAVLHDLELDQIERICAASLAAPDSLNAERTFHRLTAGQKDSLVAGLSNAGLFASHELRQGVPTRTDWEQQRTLGSALLRSRQTDLINALGYGVEQHGSTARILSVNSNRRAIAVLLDNTETFDRPSARLNAVSPVAHGLAVAQQQGLPWLLVLRDSQIRLYPARDGVGVGRKGLAETYVEIDLALLTDADAAYLPLLFSAAALSPNGTVDQILAASADHAAGLSERLRDRIYVDVVPHLAQAVANKMRATSETELAEAYHRTLVILFRLLFVAYAEDRGLLPYQRNARYTRKALKTLARELADNPDSHFDEHATDRWTDLKAVWTAVDDGNREWDVPAYNGGLFAQDPSSPTGHAIASMTLTNAEIGPALQALLVDEGPDGIGPVDFRSLSVREFGTIYEGLLESSLSLATTDLTVDPRNKNYLPAHGADPIIVRTGQVYFHNASGARKATGSYFTKSFAVEYLLDKALEPALARHLDRVRAIQETGDEAAAQDAFFDFRVVDLAMGSGHFLVAAIDRIATRFSAYLALNPIAGVTQEIARLAQTARDALGTSAPDIEIEPSALLRRQIARRCIYGLDLNTVSVELARLGIWIHTFVPGLPMSTLGHGLIQGNSLTGIGTLDEVLTILDPSTGGGTISMFEDQLVGLLSAAKDRLRRAATTAEATKAEVREAAKAHQAALDDTADAHAVLNAAVAVRLGIAHVPTGPDAAVAIGNRADVRERLNGMQAVHLPQRFPEVFMRDRPGFDVILGNPPWETLVAKEDAWWALRFPGLKGKGADEMTREIARLRRQRPDLTAQFQAETAQMNDFRDVLLSGAYPGLGSGHPDLYQAFCWRIWNSLREGGTAGVVLPRNAFSGSGTTDWRTHVYDHGAFTETSILINSGKWVFDDVHAQYTVGLTVLDKTTNPNATVGLRGPFHSLDGFINGQQNPPLTFPAAEFRGWSVGGAFPILPDEQSGMIFAQLRSHPRLDQADSTFGFRPIQGDFNASTDKAKWNQDLAARDGDMPVYKGASLNIFEPETGVLLGWAQSASIKPLMQTKRLRQGRNRRSAFYGLPVNDPSTHPVNQPRIAFRNVTNQTNRRTTIVALIPPNVVLTHGAPFLLRRAGTVADEAYLLGMLSSIPLDWYARRVVELNLVFEIFNAYPIPRPPADSPLRNRLITVTGRLAATDVRFADWAAQIDVPVGSATDPDVRADLEAELDALAGLLYGLSREDLAHMYTTFHRGWNYQERQSAALAHYDTWQTRNPNQTTKATP